ncbi:MAG: M15 family metallopeptidase [Clostridiales bacterium]|nr:M15 family metallopeptidase [Clostridiales bacterium]
MSDKRKRKENLITALLIAGMCVVVGGTIIFVVKYSNGDADEVQLMAGMTEASGVSVESDVSSFPVIEETTTAGPTDTPTPTPEPTETPTPTPEPTATPTPVPEKLTSLSGYDPGDVISSDKIDRDNLSQYFTSRSIEEGDSVYNRIYGQSYVDNDNIDLDELRYLKMLHINFDGNYQVGEMIVNEDVAGEVLEIFEILCAEGYEIYSMYLIDDFWAGDPDDSDWYSIDANNTSCFCYRTATGSGNLSKHALGKAIDINPQQNPYVTYDSDGDAHYSHDNASSYVYDRYDGEHMITTSDRAYDLFTDYGWTWGGSWSSPKDYQHFQIS